MHQGGYKVDIDFLGKCLSERKRSVSVKKKKDSANHKNELRLEKKLTDPWEKKEKTTLVYVSQRGTPWQQKAEHAAEPGSRLEVVFLTDFI